MSILALSVQYYAKVQILFPVPAKAFSPVPKVDSAVIKIIPHSSRKNPQETKKFFRVVRAGFSAKRKTLANNLANSFHFTKKDMENKLNQIGLTPLIRAQELSLEDWKKLAEII
jgi:16S rRNA (adenine1518-N6/adenine1519-N6)-dimethyltransferase